VRVSVVIPTHNEEQAIGCVLGDIPRDAVTEVIVVDGNSTDTTREIAARMGARVINESRRGYGQACLTGLATANQPDVVAFLDGDYSDRPAELPSLLDPIRQGRADIVIGSRLVSAEATGAMPWHQLRGNRLAAWLIRRLFGVQISDLGAFRAARFDVLRALDLKETTYGWAVEMILTGAAQGFRIVEVPVSYFPRIGESKISGTFRGTIGATWFILSRILGYYFRPRRSAPSTRGPVQD
jgi:glycosyltransferase involved in cell wall biosynthesis